MKLSWLLLPTLFLPTFALANPPQYTVRYLPTSDPSGMFYNYGAINNLGQVAGFDYNDNAYWLDSNNVFHYLGSPPGNPSYPTIRAFNDSDLAVGEWSNSAITEFAPAFTPTDFSLPFLPTDINGPYAEVFAVNDSGQIVGFSQGGFSPNYFLHAVMWSGGTVQDLGALPGSYDSYAFAVNKYGVAVGGSHVGSYDVPVMFSGGTVTNLGLLPGCVNGDAMGINSSGLIAGGCYAASNGAYVVVFSGGSVRQIPGLPSTLGYTDDTFAGICDDGTIVGSSYVDANNDIHGWVYSQGTTYDLNSITDQPGVVFRPSAVNGRGQILAYALPSYQQCILSPIVTSLTVTVSQRVDGGTVPDGTVVKLLNNDGTPLLPATSAPVASGVATFDNPPAPSGSNVSYEVKVCVPSGAKGLAAVQNNVLLGSTTMYLTDVVPSVCQALTITTPVAFASCKIGSITETTGLNGTGAAVWLPDGTYPVTFSMNPGVPLNVAITLGPTSTSSLVASSGFVALKAHLTRMFFTARNSNGTSYIPKTGAWSVSPDSYSVPVNGQAVSPSFWLPNGNYTGTLAGASENGSAAFNVGSPLTANGQRTITVSAGPVRQG